MRFQPSLLLPLACAFCYVAGALAVKRAASLGVGVWRTSFLSNWAIFLLFVPAWFFSGGNGHAWLDYGQPAAAAVLFFAGQIFTFLAISRGDVSVVTPVMGTKVILVALFSSVLHVGEVPLQWWIGAGLSTLAIASLHLGGGGHHRRVGQTVLLTFASAASFSLGDVLIQKWLPSWGAARFFPPMFFVVGLLSFGFVPLFRAPLCSLSGGAARWVVTGALLLAVTNAGVALAIGLVGSATAVNIVFSARGLFSVLVVWLVGHWFGSDERHLAPAVLRFRLGGATLMVAAIALVLT